MSGVRNIVGAGLAIWLVTMAGCGKPKIVWDGPVPRSWGRMKGLEKIVGNMNDRSYSRGRGQPPRPNALGEPVSMDSFAGKFVWSEYAATWCSVCAQQTPQARQIESALGGQMVFLTIMTAKGRDYNDHATVDTAKEWAGRFGLDPKRVLAANLWAKMIPEQRLYSPEGHTLFVHVGYLSAEQMRKVIDYYRGGWEKWKKEGLAAEWMTFQ